MKTALHIFLFTFTLIASVLSSTLSYAATLERGPLRLTYAPGQEALALEAIEVLHAGLLTYSARKASTSIRRRPAMLGNAPLRPS